VEVRERVSFSREELRSGLVNLGEYDGLSGLVVLSTCNRTEFYAAVEDHERGVEALRQFLNDLTQGEQDLDEYLYTYTDEEAVTHLFRVAASLDSLVLGEGQILSQVKEAYAIAREAGATSTVLNLLFHRAIAAGKRVRTETRIAYRSVSVSYAAVELAAASLGGLGGCSALIFGAGKMAELTAEHLRARGIPLRGFIFNNWQGGLMQEDNVRMVEEITGARVLARVPHGAAELPMRADVLAALYE